MPRVRPDIQARRWDLIIVEDSSRLYRHETACGELIETAVDRGIRVLGPNDNVETAQGDWENPPQEAIRHHPPANRHTANRHKPNAGRTRHAREPRRPPS